MLLFELLSGSKIPTHHSYSEIYLFTGLKFLNELNIKSSLSQNSQYHLAIVSLWPHIHSASSRSQHMLFTLLLWSNHYHSKSLIDPSTCFTSSLEPASCITQNSSSESFIPLSATFIWTCRFNLLHTAITFRHFFTISLWAQYLPFQKIYHP